LKLKEISYIHAEGYPAGELKHGPLALYVMTEEDTDIEAVDGLTLVEIPGCPDPVKPLLLTVPLQLLSYHVAVMRGTDVDQPRNLAKSVTVE